MNLKLEKFFMSMDGEIFSTNGLHEELAREICDKNHWTEWRKTYVSAADYLQEKHGFIKVSNYGDDEELHYVSMSRRYENNRRVRDNAEFVKAVLKLRIDMF